VVSFRRMSRAQLRAIFISIMSPFFIAASLSAQTPAQTPQKPEAPKSEIQTRAEALMDHARKLSDIRAKNAPGFRLKATFTFVGKDLESKRGSYTEDWVSDSQWRRETVVGDFHRVEVGTLNRTWKLDSSKDFPDTAAKVSGLMEIFPSTLARFEFESITDSTDTNPPEICATTKPGAQHERYRFCFDPKSGALIAKISPDIRPKGSSDYSCFYGIFRKLGDFWFPHEMACLQDKHRELEAKVDELAAEPPPDDALFKPPPGAIERGHCSGKLAPPTQTRNPAPNFSMGFQQGSHVSLSLIVDTQGKPQNLEVRQSGGKDFDDDALKTVQKWRFKPATCDGDPMPLEIRVEIDLHR
jgi:TonB family protein